MTKGVSLSIKMSDRSHNEWKLKPGKLKWKIKVHFNTSVDYPQEANAKTCTFNVHASSHQSKKHSLVKTNSLTALKYRKSCRRKQCMETSRSAGLCKSTGDTAQEQNSWMMWSGRAADAQAEGLQASFPLQPQALKTKPSWTTKPLLWAALLPCLHSQLINSPTLGRCFPAILPRNAVFVCSETFINDCRKETHTWNQTTSVSVGCWDFHCFVLYCAGKAFEHIDLPAGETNCTFMSAWRNRLILLLLEKLNMLNEINLCLGCSSGGEHGLVWDALGRQWPDCLTQPPHTWLSCYATWKYGSLYAPNTKVHAHTDTEASVQQGA